LVEVKEIANGEEGIVRRRTLAPQRVAGFHFYERRGLIASERISANHRVYRREILRRVTVIKIAQSAGIPLAEIAEALSQLPRDTSPDTHDWERIAENWHYDLTRRIELLTALRDKMAMWMPERATLPVGQRE
jgi:MerR family redox-sensitive transcriptional activator SoxR